MSGALTDNEDAGVFDMLGMSSSWAAVRGLSIRESVEKIFGMGFELCELGAAHKYEENAVETLMELRKNYPDKKFTLHALFPPVKVNTPNGRKNNHNSHSYAMNLADSKEHEAIIKAVRKMFDIGERINAEMIGIHGGFAGEVKFVEGDFGFEELVIKTPIPLDEAKQNMTVTIQELILMAEERGINLALEIHPPMRCAPIMTNAESFEWIFSNFKSKYFGMLLDIGHLHLASRAENYDPYEFVKKFKGKIFEVHLHDCKGVKDHLAVGVGEVDFKRHFKTIGRSVLKRVPLVFEYNNSVTEQQATKGKEVIGELLKGK